MAEFREMMSDVGEEGVYLLAELTELHSFKCFDDVPPRDRSMSARLFVRYLGDWAIFYTALRAPFAVIVLHVARYRRDGAVDPDSFGRALDEGQARLARI